MPNHPEIIIGVAIIVTFIIIAIADDDGGYGEL